MGIIIKVKQIDDTHFEVTESGDIENIITDQDREDFGVCDRELKNAAGILLHKDPSDAFLRRPTPWDDMYVKWNLDEVKKVTHVINTKVLNVSTRADVVKTHNFINKDSPVDTKFTASLEETITDTASSTWSNSNSIKVDQSISYDIKMIKGNTSFGYTRNWGNSKTESKAVSMKCGSSMALTLKPTESVAVVQTVNKKILKIEVTYESYLYGDVAMNYDGGYKGHTYYFRPIEKIMKKGKIDNSIIVKETIELDLYSDYSVAVKNMRS